MRPAHREPSSALLAHYLLEETPDRAVTDTFAAEAYRSSRRVWRLNGSAASGQTQQQAEPYLEQVVKPGMTVWITDSSAKEEKRHVVGVSPIA